jgi:hypothetical protein
MVKFHLKMSDIAGEWPYSKPYIRVIWFSTCETVREAEINQPVDYVSYKSELKVLLIVLKDSHPSNPMLGLYWMDGQPSNSMLG